MVKELQAITEKTNVPLGLAIGVGIFVLGAVVPFVVTRTYVADKLEHHDKAIADIQRDVRECRDGVIRIQSSMGIETRRGTVAGGGPPGNAP